MYNSSDFQYKKSPSVHAENLVNFLTVQGWLLLYRLIAIQSVQKYKFSIYKFEIFSQCLLDKLTSSSILHLTQSHCSPIINEV